jgi:hypothetical protein
MRMRNAYQILLEKSEGMRMFGRHGWENNTNIDLKKRECEISLDLSGSVQGPVRCCHNHGIEPSRAIKDREFVNQFLKMVSSSLTLQLRVYKNCYLSDTWLAGWLPESTLDLSDRLK